MSGVLFKDMSTPIYYDSHMHTPLCKHASGDTEDYADVALARGLKGITFTCHSPMPEGWWPQVRMNEAQLDEYLEMVERARRAYEGRLEVRVGMEMDYFPGLEWWVEKLNERLPLSHVLGSVHFFGPEYKAKFFKGDDLAFEKLYFQHLADSAETGLFDTLAHPDLIKNHRPQLWSFERLEECIHESLQRISKTKVAMELNTSGILKRYPETNPGPQMLKLMHQYGIPVVLGSDSHSPKRVGSDFLFATQMLEEAGYTKASYFIGRRRFECALDLIANSVVSVLPAKEV
jgi:histidinol-phosphatase (PHP family)